MLAALAPPLPATSPTALHPPLARATVARLRPLVDHAGTAQSGEPSPRDDALGWLTRKEPDRMVSGDPGSGPSAGSGPVAGSIGGLPSHPDDAALVAQAIAGDQHAFEQLRAGAEYVVRGTIRMQAGRAGDSGSYLVDHALVDDLAQVTWLQIWQKLPSYNAEVAPFNAFARYWARIMVRRYRDTPIGRGLETPLSALLDRDDEDDGPTDHLDRLAGQGGQAAMHPDDTVPAEVYDELLTVTFATVSPPHQLIVFGFTKAADLKPRQIAAGLSDLPLRTLAQRLEQAYVEQSDLPASRVRPAFAPLHERLGRRFDEIVRDPTTLATYPQLHARIVGETTLADYYTAEPTANLTQWWHAVKRRVIADLQRRQTGPLAELLQQSQRMSTRRAASQRTGS
jgi:DNA-directed RNA polymerase specialized sigma24 family protein